MFTRNDQLQRKGGPEERFSFLNKLKIEFTTTKSLEAKQQVLANLANFAYDPLNYQFIKQLHIVDIFLGQLQHREEDPALLAYAVGGLCNLCNDPEFAHHIIACDGAQLLSEVLHHRDRDIALNALTTLYFLGADKQHRHLITTPSIIGKLLDYSSTHSRIGSDEAVDSRLANLTSIFFSDLCDARQIESAKAIASQACNPHNIPLPASTSASTSDD